MSKKKKKKVNPHRSPRTQADVNRAKYGAIEDAIRMTKVLMFTALLDKKGFTLDDLVDVWEQVEKLSDSVTEGRITIADMACVLREEYGLQV